jgi:hypothetical protein
MTSSHRITAAVRGHADPDDFIAIGISGSQLVNVEPLGLIDRTVRRLDVRDAIELDLLLSSRCVYRLQVEDEAVDRPATKLSDLIVRWDVQLETKCLKLILQVTITLEDLCLPTGALPIRACAAVELR